MNFKFDGNRLFFTSDTHFNHTNILQYCNRPFKTIDQMNETIITNWNRVVGPDDVIYKIPESGVISRPAASTSCRSFFITSA